VQARHGVQLGHEGQLVDEGRAAHGPPYSHSSE
jgi:hypothetical protein